MDPTVIILSVLFFTSLIMSAAMAIAWASFGRPRHALTWALAFGLNAVQVPVNAAAIYLFGRSPVAMALSGVMIVVLTSLIAVGARQRAGLPGRMHWFAGGCVLGFALILTFTLIFPMRPVQMAIPSFFAAAMLLACALATVPRARRPSAAEIAMITAFGCFALYELVITGLVAHYGLHPGEAAARDTYRAVLGIGLPAFSVATGITAILLLASDLAQQLRRLAASDPLTGVLNRRGFNDAALVAIANARRQRQPVSVAIADIDRFKPINDRFGHAVGDQTLARFAGHLAASVRRGDMVGRIGGEEFAALLVAAPGASAAEVMDRIRADLADIAIDAPSPIILSASFGIAEVGPRGLIEDALADALDRADQALYQSKMAGRNRVTLFGGAAADWQGERVTIPAETVLV